MRYCRLVSFCTPYQCSPSHPDLMAGCSARRPPAAERLASGAVLPRGFPRAVCASRCPRADRSPSQKTLSASEARASFLIFSSHALARPLRRITVYREEGGVHGHVYHVCHVCEGALKACNCGLFSCHLRRQTAS